MKKLEFLQLCEAFSERALRHHMPETVGLPARAGAPRLDAFYACWPIGGMSGGDEWGGAPAAFIAEAPEPPFEGLEQLLNIWFPELRYSAYQALAAQVQRSSRTVQAVHGNCTHYAIKTVRFDALLAVLQAEGLVFETEPQASKG